MSNKRRLRKIPQSIKSLLIATCERAKDHRSMSHPLDRECLYKFIVVCHKKGIKFSGRDFYDYLIAYGVHEELAEKLRYEYEIGREVLKVYRHGTLYPPTPEAKRRQIELLLKQSEVS